MDYVVRVGDRKMYVALSDTGLRIDGSPLDVELVERSVSAVRGVRIGRRFMSVLPRRNGRGDWTLDVDGRTYRAQVLDTRQEAVQRAQKSAAVATGPAPLRAPMPGLVVRVEVEVGAEVDRGDGVVIVEAMKMENELKAEAPGRVSAVLVEAGETVEKDQTLMRFEALEGE